LIKVSKDLDFSLVSNKSLSEILPSSSLGLGTNEVGQKGLKNSTYDVTHKKLQTQDQKCYFHCRCEDLPNLLRVWTAL